MTPHSPADVAQHMVLRLSVHLTTAVPETVNYHKKKKQKKKEKHSYSEINKREKRKNIMHLEKEETENKYLPFTGYISTLFMRLKSHEINK